MNLADLLVQAIQIPAIQGIVAALGAEAVKRAPVGPSGGPGVRLVAAVFALGSVIAGAAAQGTLGQLDPKTVGDAVTEAVAALLAAVGAWQLARSAKA